MTAPGEIDLVNVSDLCGQLTAACRSSTVVVVDMTATTFCDSAGIHALARAWELAARRGGELRLAIGCSHALRIIQLTGLDQVVPIYPDVQQSLSAPRSGSEDARGSPI